MKVMKIVYVSASVVIVAIVVGILLGFEIVTGVGILLLIAITLFVFSGAIVTLESFDKCESKPHPHSVPAIYHPLTYEMKQRIWVSSRGLQVGHIVSCKYYGTTAFSDEHCIVMEIKDKELVVKGLTTGQVYTMPYYAFIRSM